MEATGVNIATAENALEEFEWDTDAAISAIK